MNAKQIKKLRKENDLTQEALAKMIGVSKRTIINYEQGEVIPESKVKLFHSIFNNVNTVTGNKNNNVVNVDSSGEVDRLKEENKRLNEKLLECQEKLIDLLSKNT